MYLVLLPWSLRWQPFSLRSRWSPTKEWVECFHNSSMEFLCNNVHSDNNPNKNFDQIHAKELVCMTVYYLRKYIKLKRAFVQERKPLMWERLKYTKRFDWVDQSKVISLFFSFIHFWYPRSILTNPILPLTTEWHLGFETSHTLPLTWCQNTDSKTNTSWKRTSWRRENLWQKLRPNNPRFTTSSPTDPCSSLQKENFSNSPLGLEGSMWLPSCSQRSVENLKLQSNLDVAVLRNVDFLSEKPVQVTRRTAKKQKIMIVVKRKSLQLDYT